MAGAALGQPRVPSPCSLCSGPSELPPCSPGALGRRYCPQVASSSSGPLSPAWSLVDSRLLQDRTEKGGGLREAGAGAGWELSLHSQPRALGPRGLLGETEWGRSGGCSHLRPREIRFWGFPDGGPLEGRGWAERGQEGHEVLPSPDPAGGAPRFWGTQERTGGTPGTLCWASWLCLPQATAHSPGVRPGPPHTLSSHRQPCPLPTPAVTPRSATRSVEVQAFTLLSTHGSPGWLHWALPQATAWHAREPGCPGWPWPGRSAGDLTAPRPGQPASHWAKPICTLPGGPAQAGPLAGGHWEAQPHQTLVVVAQCPLSPQSSP